MFVCVHVYYCCECVSGGPGISKRVVPPMQNCLLPGVCSSRQTQELQLTPLLGYLFITRHVPQMIGGEELG